MRYNLEKMIETGNRAIERNRRRDLTIDDYKWLAHISDDRYKITSAAFCMGVAVGMRIAATEQKKSKPIPPA